MTTVLRCTGPNRDFRLPKRRRRDHIHCIYREGESCKLGEERKNVVCAPPVARRTGVQSYLLTSWKISFLTLYNVDMEGQ